MTSSPTQFLQAKVFLILFFALPCTTKRPDEDDKYGWIRVCTRDGDRYDTLTTDCPKGIFLKEPMLPGCVCLQGTWVLHSTLCDHSAYIFYGEKEQERCYQIDFNISMFIYLGDPGNFKKSMTYVSPHSLTVFHEIAPGKPTPVIDFHWPTVITINSKRSIQATEKGKSSSICFSSVEYISKDRVIRGHFWDSARGPTSYKLVDSCGDMFPGGFDNLIGTHNDFSYRSNIAVPVPYSPCSSKCGPMVTTTTPPSTSKRRQKRYKTRDTVETTWDGLGFCMQSYWDPILKFEMVNAEEKTCYPEKKDYIVS